MTSSHRRAYVDWARGIAVLVMIEAHTVDAWTRLSPGDDEPRAVQQELMTFHAARAAEHEAPTG